MNSRFRNAVVFALLLPFATMAVAEARPGGSSFRGGFSSHKSSVTRSAPAPAPKQPSFGSFGSRRPDAAPAHPVSPAPDAARGGSAMSRDLDRSAAQERAVRNWDARRDAPAASGTPPLPPLNPVLPGGVSAGRSGSAGAADTRTAGNGASPGGYGQPAPAPVVIRERGGSNAWLWGIGGYLLGSHAMSHAKDVPPAPSQPASTGTTSPDAHPAGAAASAAGGTAASDDAAPRSDLDALTASASKAAENAAAASVQATEPLPTPAVEAKKERSTVRTLTWALLIFGFAWLLWIGWRHARAGKKNANYTLERN